MALKPRGCRPTLEASALFPLHGDPAGETNSIYFPALPQPPLWTLAVAQPLCAIINSSDATAITVPYRAYSQNQRKELIGAKQREAIERDERTGALLSNKIKCKNRCALSPRSLDGN